MQGTQLNNLHANLKCESVWFKTKLISKFLTISFLLTQPFYLPYLHAAPTGGNVVGGSGSISQSDLTTTIHQSSQNLAVNWQSFDVNTNEKVNFVQPNTSSIALNRIIGNNGSTIQGQINANGQVILVNPNGVFFTPTATINAGGLIASSLDMTPTNFMNGNYIFNEVLGTEGSVINSGIINASVGGNVALIGKQVKNDGLISANLGSVVLAAGKQSILTFDNQGLIGVSVTKEVLQSELGLDAAVTNNGEINASGGRVLLTASTSQDVFSQAVNNDALAPATSVVIHENGSFTLGGGADVINTGSIDVSSQFNKDNTVRIIMLGENVTSSGSLTADTESGNGGEIELHAKDTTLLTQNSRTSAQGLNSGNGGVVKVLGDKVGLFDQSIINVSGFNGGGQALVGGDYQGKNNLLRNAQGVYVSRGSKIYADAFIEGNGGKIINWADVSTSFYGEAYSRGGSLLGDGGLVEVSGKQLLNFKGNVNTLAVNGIDGELLLDPVNITIFDGRDDSSPDGDRSDFSFTGQNATNFQEEVGKILYTDNDLISGLFESELEGLSATTNIRIEASNNITINSVGELDLNTGPNRSVIFTADADSNGVGDFSMDVSERITSEGASITISGANVTVGEINSNFSLDDDVSGGAINITATNGTLQARKISSNGGDGSNDNAGAAAGKITLEASSDITISNVISAKGGDGKANTNDTAFVGGVGADIKLTSTAGNITIQNDIESSAGLSDVKRDGQANGAAAGKIDLITTDKSKTIQLQGDLLALGGELVDSSGDDTTNGAGGKITLDGKVVLNGTNLVIDSSIDYQGTDPRGTVVAGDVEFKYAVDGNTAGADNLTVFGNNISFLADVGSNTKLGNLTFGSLSTPDNIILGNIDFASRNVNQSINTRYDIYATSLTAFLYGDFTSGNIYTKGLVPVSTPVADAVYIDSVPGDIDISSIDASGIAAAGDQDGFNGGNVILVGDDINIGSINTSGSNASTSIPSTPTNQNGGYAGYVYLSAETDANSTITLSGDITANGGTATGTGTIGDSNNLYFDAYNVATEGSRVFSAIGNNNNNTGNIDFLRYDFDSDPTPDDFFISNLSLGGNLTINSGDGGYISLFTNVDYNNAATSSLTLNSGGDIRIDGNITDSTPDIADKLNISLNATGDVNIGTSTTESTLDINTDGGIFNVDAVNYNGDSDAVTKKTISTINQADNTIIGTSTIIASQAVVLGEMIVGDTLDVTAGTTITQGVTGATPDTLNTKGLASFKTTGGTATDDITLNNDNVFEGNIDLSTNDGGLIANAYQSDISIKNTHTETLINDVSIYGNLTVNADKNLSLVGTIDAYNNDDAGSRTTSINLNFGQADLDGAAGSIFTATGASLSVDATSLDDVTNVTISGGLGLDTFNFNDSTVSSIVTSFSNINILNINGSNSSDIFNINTSAGSNSLTNFSDVKTINFSGNDGDDVFNIGHASDITNRINFTTVGTLRFNGNLGDDDFTVRNIGFASVTDVEINGNENADEFFIYTDIEGINSAILNGDAGVDTFNFNDVGLKVTTINGGTEVDIINAANENNFWLIEGIGDGRIYSADPGNAAPYPTTQRVSFIDVETLNGNDSNDTYIFTVDPSTSSITADGKGSTTDIVRLANNLSSVTLGAGSFTGIERYVGNANSNTLQGALGGINTWRIEDVDGAGIDFDGVNDGTVNGIEFVDFSTLQGGASNSTDNFTFYGTASVTGTTGIDGNGGTDSITGPADTDNTWIVTAANDGSMNGNTFIDIDNLNGSNFNDSFTFNVDPSTSGITIDGAGQQAGGRDEVILGAGLSNVTLVAGSLIGIERYAGNSNANTLQGALGGINTWRIEDVDGAGIDFDGVNDGTVNGIEFVDFSTLQGGASNSTDNFTFYGTASVTGTTGIDGNGGTDSITGPADTDNTWIVTAANDGSMNGNTFIDIDNLNGSNFNDSFTFNVDPSTSGITIDGAGQQAGGRDEVILGAGLSNVTLVAGSLIGIERYAGNSNANTLQGALGGINTWRIEDVDGAGIDFDGVNDGTVNSIEFVDFSTLQGGASNSTDNFTFYGTASVTGTTGIDGNGGTDSITGPADTDNTWIVTAANDGSMNGNTFIDIDNLNGSNFNDSFTFNVDPSTSGITIDGAGQQAGGRDEVILGAGLSNVTLVAGSLIGIERYAGNSNANTLQGALGGINTWRIEDVDGAGIDFDGVNDGTVNGIEFVDFSTLQGGASNSTDNFTFYGTASVTGTTGIDGNGGTDSITGPADTDNTWIVTAANDGSMNGNTFIDIDNLNGSNFNDSFTFNVDPSTSGITIDGAGQQAGGRDEVILGAGLSNVTLVAGSLIGIERYAGNSNANTLQGALGGINTWRIEDVDGAGIDFDGVNDGTVNSIEFVDFSTLQGGASNSTDNFTFYGTASVNGVTGIDGNGGTDSITGPDLAVNNWTITDATAGSVNGTTFTGITTLTGGINSDRFVLSNVNEFTGNIIGGSGIDRITAATISNNWNVTGTNTGTVTGLTNQFTSFEELVGGGSDDHLQLHDSIIFSGTFDGAGGTDEIIGGSRATDNEWEITALNNTGTVTGLTSTFTQVELLSGGSNNDSFKLHNTIDFNGTIYGGSGTDTLTGGTRSNNWAITAAGNTGTVNGLSNTFTNIEALIGGDSDDHLQLHSTINFSGTFDGASGVDEILGGNRPNTWVITEENTAGTEVAGTVTGLTGTLAGFTTGNFKNVETLTGNNNTDDYTLLTGVTFSGSIDGGTGANTLTAGDNANNTWSIIGNNRGDVTGISNTTGVGFSNIQTLTGGAGSDLFKFALNGDVDGLIDGNSGSVSSIDVIDIRDFNVETQVELGLEATYDSNVLNVHNIEDIKARDNVNGTVLNNIIVGANRQNTWVIDGVNSGYVEETGNTNPETTTKFSNFRTVLGSDLDDIFRFEGTDSVIDTKIDGLGGINSIDFSQQTGDVVVNLNTGASVLNQVDNVTRIIGNGTSSTFIAENGVDNTWDFYGTNTGEVDGIIFTDFNILEGGDQVDIFNFDGTSVQAAADPIVQTIDLQINGNAGDDVLNLSLSDSEKGLINFDGGTFDTSNELNVSGGSSNYYATYTPDVTTDTDNLSYSSGTNTFAVNYKNTDAVDDSSTANTLELVGSNVSDTFTLTDNTFNVTATTPGYVRLNDVTYSGKNNVTVTGSVGDVVVLPSDFTLTGTLSLDINSIDHGSNLITVGALNLNNVGNIGTPTSRLRINTTYLSVIDSGNIYIDDNDGSGINLTGLSNVSLLDILSDGTVSSTNQLTSSGVVTINATAGDIRLTNSLNNLTGALTLNAPVGNITLNNDAVTNIASVDTNILNVTSSGDLNQTGNIYATSVNLSSDSNISLALANDVDNLTVNDAIDVRFNDIDDLTVQSINASGNVNITTGNLLTVASNITTTGSVSTSSNGLILGLIESDNIILNAGGGSITGSSTNIINNGTAELIATGGISVELEMNGALTATNYGTGDISISKTGELILEDITNNNSSGGFLLVSNGGNTTVKKITLDYDNPQAEVNFVFNSIGNLYGDTSTSPHITANRAIFNMNASGSVGRSNAEPIITNVKDYIEVTGALGTYIRYYNGIFDGEFVGDNEYKNIALQIIENLAGQQMIEVESLAELDPAIFTDVRNYSNSDVALMMPSDQRYTDDEEDEEAKEKRMKFINSAN